MSKVTPSATETTTIPTTTKTTTIQATTQTTIPTKTTTIPTTVPGVCNRRDCPTENGGCKMEQCFCDSGYQLSESNTCQELEPGEINIRFTVAVKLSIQADELSNKESNTYLNLSEDVSQELWRKLGLEEAGITGVHVIRLRIGSLIVDAGVLVDKVNFPDAMSSLAGQLQQLRKDKFVVLGQTGDVIQMTVNGTEVGWSWTSCQVLQTINPCSAHQQCDDSGDQPVCRTMNNTSDSIDSRLVIGLVVAGITALIGFAVACYCVKRGQSCSKSENIAAGSLYTERVCASSENPYVEPVKTFRSRALFADTYRNQALGDSTYSSVDGVREEPLHNRLARPKSASNIGFTFGLDSPQK